MKRIGFFPELGYDEPGARLADARRDNAWTDQALVVAYLRGGTRLTFAMGFEDDVFDSTKEAGTASQFTDGTYVWPETLAERHLRLRCAGGATTKVV